MTYKPHSLRFQLSRKSGYRKPDGAVVVSRPSRFGNCFKVGMRVAYFPELGWGLPVEREVGPFSEGGICEVIEIKTVEQCVEIYRAWLKSSMTTALQKLDVTPLRGKQLGCWCPLDKPCHADVLCEIANAAPATPEKTEAP